MTSLNSDHVNYLIFRYLQEAGHENAAQVFSRDWRRSSEYRDPENYPWATVVRRHELVNIIQSGLHHDELQARVRKNDRRFNFTRVTSREGLGRQDGPVLENGAAGSRPSSSAKRKGRPPVMRPPDDFPTPAPKRQRRSEGSEGVHLNGDRDAMDVDAVSPSADAEDDGEAVSPAIASEPDMMEVPERYDSMDVAVQTDVKTGPKTSTMYWKIDKPNATIFHSIFNPNSDPKYGKTLLTVGESLCRIYDVPEDLDSATQVQCIDEPSLPPNAVITAATWHPHGEAAVCAIDSIRELPDGQQTSEQTILHVNSHSGTSSPYNVPPLLEPAGIVLALRYSPDQQLLLVLRMNLKRGLVTVYGQKQQDQESLDPLAWRMFEHPVLDAAWIGPSQFLVCGENGYVESFSIDSTSQLSDTTATADNIMMRGLQTSPISWTVEKPNHKWDKARYDEQSGTFAIASSDEKRMVVGQKLDNATLSTIRDVDLSGHLTAIAFRPEPLQDERAGSVFAVAVEEGSCMLYSTTQLRPAAQDSFKETVTVHLTEGPALALAWSQDGAFLAVGGVDLVQIWTVEHLIRRIGQNEIEANDSTPQGPVVTWRPDAKAVGPRNGEHEEARPLSEPSLSWSADGKSLGFAVDKQMAVIRFRPPLDSASGLNGHPA